MEISFRYRNGFAGNVERGNCGGVNVQSHRGPHYVDCRHGLEPTKTTGIGVETAALAAEVQARPTSMPRSKRRAWLFQALALALLFVLSAGLWLGFVFTNRPAELPSLLVIAFDDLTPDKSASYLASGIADDLTADLASFPGTRVLSRKAAIAYPDKGATPQQIGKSLDVRYLQGSVRREGPALRINAELVDTQDGAALWARRFEGRWGELLQMQQQMKDGIAEHLSLRAVAGKPRPGSTGYVAAYEEYLKAFADWRDGSPAAVGRAIARLRQAINIDPDYGRAWALMAFIYWNSVGVEERQTVLGTSRAQTMHGMDANLLLALETFPYKNPADNSRLLNALAKAGIRRLPANFDNNGAEPLTDDEIRGLILGRTVEGVNLPDGSVIRRTTGADGVSSYAHKGETVSGGMATVEQNGLCDWWLTGRNCVAILKDPADPTGEHYFWIDSMGQWGFHVVGTF
jgi:TolB-like protein